MYSEDGLLGCTHSVEEQAANVRPAMASMHIERMKSSCLGCSGGTLNRPTIAVKPLRPFLRAVEAQCQSI
jgi:hypothetical protein